MTCLAIAGACVWAVILLLPWRPWAVSEVLDAPQGGIKEDLGDITVLIPARNEAAVIQKTLSGVKAQGQDLQVVIVDDRSTDETGLKARNAGLPGLRIITGRPPPEGWTGKLWALEQGLSHVHTPVVLLLDADIALKPGILQALGRKMRTEDLHLVSLMASLRMAHFYEKLFMPAFIYFFKMLYPFRLSNSPASRVAAAAGGCILVKKEALLSSGGFRAVRRELIDDCALAGQMKRAGGRTWIGLSHSVESVRAYDGLRDIWDMVARTAFHQLRYSLVRLMGCTGAMIMVFWFPPAGLFGCSTLSKLLSAGALGAMILSYLPTLWFYKKSPAWAVLLPVIAAGYLAMTWASAVRFWLGKGAVWKGRRYGSKKTASMKHKGARQ